MTSRLAHRAKKAPTLVSNSPTRLTVLRRRKPWKNCWSRAFWRSWSNRVIRQIKSNSRCPRLHLLPQVRRSPKASDAMAHWGRATPTAVSNWTSPCLAGRTAVSELGVSSLSLKTRNKAWAISTPSKNCERTSSSMRFRKWPLLEMAKVTALTWSRIFTASQVPQVWKWTKKWTRISIWQNHQLHIQVPKRIQN